MTQNKAYNLKVYCDIRNITIDSEEAIEFLEKKFYEQLTIIKGLRTDNSKEPEEEEEESKGYSFLDRIIQK